MPGINVVFQLMGGTGSAFVCYMLPAAFAWKLQLPQLRPLWGKAACLGLFFVGLVIGDHRLPHANPSPNPNPKPKPNPN